MWELMEVVVTGGDGDGRNGVGGDGGDGCGGYGVLVMGVK